MGDVQGCMQANAPHPPNSELLFLKRAPRMREPQATKPAVITDGASSPVSFFPETVGEKLERATDHEGHRRAEKTGAQRLGGGQDRLCDLPQALG